MKEFINAQLFDSDRKAKLLYLGLNRGSIVALRLGWSENIHRFRKTVKSSVNRVIVYYGRAKSNFQWLSIWARIKRAILNIFIVLYIIFGHGIKA